MLSELNNLIANTVEHEFGHTLEARSGLVSYAEAGHGDFASNVAFRLARELKMAPAAIAAKLADALEHPMLASAAEAAGYVNMVMKDEFWAEELAKVTPAYGSSTIGQGKKVQVEFISANPTGPLTMANARGGYPGDVLASVLKRSGYEVVREFYVNDGGGQVTQLVKSVKAAAGLAVDGETQYNGDYIGQLATELVPTADSDDDELGKAAIARLMEGIKASVARMGVEFDEWFSERSLVDTGSVAKAIESLRAKGLVYEKDGATWLRSTSYGDERDRVIIKSNGESVYLINDVAYHQNIFGDRGFDKAIKIWGADHAGQVASLKLTVEQLLPGKELDFILVQLVRLIRDGQEVKMSKRAGVFVTMDELLDEVGEDVARFLFLMRSTDAQMDFDLDLAREHSQKNPYWYVMYSYARANSIMAQAAEKGLKPAKEINVLTDQERSLIKHITLLPNLLEGIAEDYGVHRLAYYGMDMAKLFHDFYESEKIIDLQPAKAVEKLYLIQQYIQFMNVYFAILGITPIEKM